MVQAVFRYRRSKRLALVELDGEMVEAYISNGADMEFLQEGAVCYLREVESTTRSTAFDLVSVYDRDTLVCIDTREPLHAGMIWLKDRLQKENPGSRITMVDDPKQSLVYTSVDTKSGAVVQIMGSSLYKDGGAYLPERKSSVLNRRLEFLLDRKGRGYDFRLLFVICRNDVSFFRVDWDADPYFAQLVAMLKSGGTDIWCLRCAVDAEGMKPDRLIDLVL